MIALLIPSWGLYAGEVQVFVGRPTGVIKFVYPEYPPKLRMLGLNGKGLFLLKINPKAGDVDEVKVLKSARYSILNEFAAKAFFQWKSQPSVATEVKVPCEFYARGLSRDLH